MSTSGSAFVNFIDVQKSYDGETLVVSGFTRDREIKEKKAVGINGGWFGRGTVVTHRRVEMVILLTARIVASVAGQ